MRGELWKYRGVTGAIDEIKKLLSDRETAGREYTTGRIPTEYELRRYVLMCTDKRHFKEGLYWITDSLELNADRERLLLNIRIVNNEYIFLLGYFRTEAHLYTIHSRK